MKRKILVSHLLILFALSLQAQSDSLKTRNIILVTLDGLRWQEVFTGADPNLIKNKKYVVNDIYDKYWNNDPVVRRSKLMPFLWSTFVPGGQIYGNRNNRSFFSLTNIHHTSYPGYNELLTGFADPGIENNDHGVNRNENIFDFIIKNRTEFKEKIAVFASWQPFNGILNEKPGHIIVNAGLEEIDPQLLLPGHEILNDMQFSLPDVFDGIRLDALTYYMAFSYLKMNRPRILYLALDETDDFAHQGRYDHYLNSARYSDTLIQQLWNWIQTDSEYKNTTTLILTSDHGRGDGKKWTSHGSKTPGSDATWFAVIGPDTPAAGEVADVQYYHNQIAATIAALLGMDYVSDNPHGKPIFKVLGK